MEDSYLISSEDVLTNLETNPNGLTQQEASNRILKYGPNSIQTTEQTSLFKLFLAQLANPLVIMLLCAVGISFFTGKYFEAILIASIVIFMAIIGVYLEKKANNAVEKLKEFVKDNSTVIRDGKPIKIESHEIVPGDILFLQEGDKIAADARVIYANLASVDEAILTGESVPVNKTDAKLSDKVIIGDQKNMIFSGTFIVQGNLKAVVVATGSNTELGKITMKLSSAEEKLTPLQAQLSELSKILSIGTIILCSIILILSVLRGQPIIEGLTQSLSLAIAFIPEGLSAVMTVVLALGVREMVKKDVIVKRLLAAEGLGSINILATDKTGTITTGFMTVEKIRLANKEVDISKFNPKNLIENKILDIIRFCNNQKGATEVALIKFLERFDFVFELREREKEFAFSSTLKRMSIIHKGESNYNLFSKGAPDILIPLCTHYIEEGSEELKEFTDEQKQNTIKDFEKLAREGYRVLCLAYKDIPHSADINEREKVETNLVFASLIGLIDPLREDVKETVQKLKNASIKAIMITGDHPEIARTIALNAGIVDDPNAEVISGSDLEGYIKGENDITPEKILNCSIFARVTPEHKEVLVDIFKDSGFLVAMAGDGLNDVVAISKASIGIGVVNATDIVKEAADVIITGSYSALANAVEMGRLVMFRTRLYLHYLLSGNFCQVGVFILCLLFNMPFPLTAIQLLIINLLTDAAPAMAMAFEKGTKNTMNEPPKPKSESIINSYIWKSIFFQGLASSIFLFVVFYVTLPTGIIFAQTATFTAYLFQKLMRAFTARSFKESIRHYGMFTNKAIVYSVLLGFVVWFLIVFVFAEAFKMTPIDISTLVVIAIGATLMPLLEEILKWRNSRLKV